MVETINEFIGKTLTHHMYDEDSEELFLQFANGDHYKMYHRQDCCEYVWLEDIVGSLENLYGLPIMQAFETSNQEYTDYGSETWTFYTLGTFYDSVTLRWCGQSNGYYSEEVCIEKV
jgi:hypothetical protein